MKASSNALYAVPHQAMGRLTKEQEQVVFDLLQRAQHEGAKAFEGMMQVFNQPPCDGEEFHSGKMFVMPESSGKSPAAFSALGGLQSKIKALERFSKDAPKVLQRQGSIMKRSSPYELGSKGASGQQDSPFRCCGNAADCKKKDKVFDKAVDRANHEAKCDATLRQLHGAFQCTAGCQHHFSSDEDRTRHEEVCQKVLVVFNSVVAGVASDFRVGLVAGGVGVAAPRLAAGAGGLAPSLAAEGGDIIRSPAAEGGGATPSFSAGGGPGGQAAACSTGAGAGGGSSKMQELFAAAGEEGGVERELGGMGAGARVQLLGKVRIPNSWARCDSGTTISED